MPRMRLLLLGSLLAVGGAVHAQPRLHLRHARISTPSRAHVLAAARRPQQPLVPPVGFTWSAVEELGFGRGAAIGVGRSLASPPDLLFLPPDDQADITADDQTDAITIRTADGGDSSDQLSSSEVSASEVSASEVSASEVSASGRYPPTPSLLECFSFAIPALGIYVASPLMSLIDAAFVGRYLISPPRHPFLPYVAHPFSPYLNIRFFVSFVGRECGTVELAALGPSGAISDSAPQILLFISIAATNLIARSSRAGAVTEATQRTCSACLLLSVLGGSLIGALVYGFATPLSVLYCGKTSLELVPLAASYVRIRALALPAVVLASAAQAVCVGLKDTRTPLKAILLAGEW